MDNYWHFQFTFVNSKCKRSSLLQQWCMILFLQFSNTVYLCVSKYEIGPLVLLCSNSDLFQAAGNPTPEIIWYKGKFPVKESSRVAVINSNTELRISHIRESDLDEYTCVARNGVEDAVRFTTRLVLAGTVITTPTLHNGFLKSLEIEAQQYLSNELTLFENYSK